jgi:23S rRNA-/tRNA-specific pseudouridylate synthase
MKLDILYEDENLLVINKDAGVNVHPVPGSEGKT